MFSNYVKQKGSRHVKREGFRLRLGTRLEGEDPYVDNVVHCCVMASWINATFLVIGDPKGHITLL